MFLQTHDMSGNGHNALFSGMCTSSWSSDFPGACKSIITPVSGVKLSATVLLQGNIRLQWNTFSELNNKGFYIQCRTNSTDWSTIAFKPSKATNGNSMVLLSYTYTDMNSVMRNVFYRLIQENIDGTQSSPSNIVLITGENRIGSITVYPNPTRSIVYIDSINDLSKVSKIVLLDLSGRKILETSYLKNGLNVSNLSVGVYMLEILFQDKTITGIKIIVQE